MLNQVLANVLKPSAEAQKTAKALGLEFDAAAIKSKGLAGFLKDIVAYIGTDRMRFSNPVYPGDSIRMIVEVTDKKKTNKGWICQYDWTIQNQDGINVAGGHNT